MKSDRFDIYSIWYRAVLQQILFDKPLVGFVNEITFRSVVRGGEQHALRRGVSLDFVEYVRKHKFERGRVRMYAVNDCIRTTKDPTASVRDHIYDCLNLARYY